MIESPITILSQGEQLVGMVHQPQVGNGTAVILCHGYTGQKTENKRLFVEAARAFTAVGFWALRFDFYGSGDSAGEFRSTRISTNIQNLRDVLARVRGLGFEHVVVLGISMGAATAILTLHNEPATGLILWSTVPDMRELFEQRLGRSLDSVPVMPMYEYDGWLIDREFYLDAIKYNIFEHLKKLHLPKLIVQGTADDPLFVAGFQRFKAVVPSPVEFQLIQDANHTYEMVKHRNEIIQLTSAWLQKILKQNQQS